MTMLKKLSFTCLLIFSLASITSSLAAHQLPISQEEVQQLAQKKQWQHLLHYRLHPYTLSFKSQNDSPNFFLSPQGKTSLTAELAAALTEFLKTNQSANASAQCRFPARYQWLKKQLPEINFTDQACPEFNQWQTEIAAEYLTLIFPAAYINSPSSMYGHTLIRLDKQDEHSSKLLAYSANFAANANTQDNQLKFSYKGLTGGYPGVVSILPYYAKTNEYSRMEHRDIWEYKLSLTSNEVKQFVRHLWETKDSYFDYFFFDENCSYRLLALLDASSERLDLAGQFNFTATPVDTIRALQQAGVVETKAFRPSSASEMEHHSSQASKEVLRLAKLLVDDLTSDIAASLAHLNPQETSQTLELAYAYARYLSVKKRQANPQRARTLALLSARSKQPVAAGFTPVPEPQFSDDQGHGSQKLNLTWGAASQTASASLKKFADLNWRMAYHDIMDLPQGFAPGAQIVMGDFKLRAWEGGKLSLQDFTLIDILSLSEQTPLQSPIAWGVSTGGERFLGASSRLNYYLKASFGKAILTPAGRLYALAQAEALTGQDLHKGMQISLGPKAGWLVSNHKLQANLEVNYQGLALIDKTRRLETKAELGLYLSTNLQLRLSAKQQHFKLRGASWHNEEISTGVNWYF